LYVEEVGKRLVHTGSERPLIAHIWGTKPEAFYQVAQQLVELKFDGIDLNMGCPEKNVVAHGCCSALIENPSLAKEMIEATKKGAGDLPVSVKTRIGFKTIKTEEWIGFLLQQDLAALTVHFRTQKEMSLVPAHWEETEKIIKLRNELAPSTIIVGNGDVLSKKQGNALAKKYGLDGIMIGRGVFQNPYVFNDAVDYASQSKEERVKLLKKHIEIFKDTWAIKHPLSERSYMKSYPPLKRYFKIYIQGFDGASDLREKLMLTQTIEEAEKVLCAIS
jgi:tRNA-dihydrouridine synthase